MGDCTLIADAWDLNEGESAVVIKLYLPAVVVHVSGAS